MVTSKIPHKHSAHLHIVREDRFIVLVQLKLDFRNTCKHVSLAEIVLKLIS